MLKNFEAAKTNLDEALIISKKLNFQPNLARTYLNLGSLEYEKKNYNDALVNFNKGLELYEASGIEYNIALSNYRIGQTYFKKKEFNNALKYLNKNIEISNKLNDAGALKDAYYEKSLVLKAQNKYENALSVFLKSKTLSDSIFTIEKERAITEYQTIYETERKEQEIIIQKSQIKTLEQKAEISKLHKLLLAIGLLAVFIISGLGFYSFKQKTKRNKIEKEKLDNELLFKKKELTTHALHLAKKNEVLEDLKSKAEILKASENNKKGYQQLIRAINFDLQDDKNWDNFSRYFEEVHQGFNEKAQQKFPSITANDLRLMALLKMNLTSKEIANILNISGEGIKKARYRLRKKLNLSTTDSLEDYILAFA